MVLTSQAAHQALAELRDPAVLSPAPGPALSASTEQPLDRLAEWHSSLTMVCRPTQFLNSLLFCRNLFPNFFLPSGSQEGLVQLCPSTSSFSARQCVPGWSGMCLQAVGDGTVFVIFTETSYSAGLNRDEPQVRNVNHGDCALCLLSSLKNETKSFYTHSFSPKPLL